MMEVDITRQCKVGLEFSHTGEALVYLYHNEFATEEEEKRKCIGLFDKYGFHFMDSPEVLKAYRVEDGYKAHHGIIWFKVYQKKEKVIK